MQPARGSSWSGPRPESGCLSMQPAWGPRGVLGTGLPGLGTEHLPGALCSGTGSPALGLRGWQSDGWRGHGAGGRGPSAPFQDRAAVEVQSKGLSRVFSNTTVQKHQFFSVQPSSQSNSHIHTLRKGTSHPPAAEQTSTAARSWKGAEGPLPPAPCPRHPSLCQPREVMID